MGMQKHKLEHFWRRFRLISLVGLILVWVLALVGTGFSLRQNNLEMLRLREAVFTADKDNKGLEVALKSLQSYVTTHMNASLPKLGDQKAIQLKYTYDRLVAAEEARVAGERVRITNEATAYCESTLPSVRLTERAKCVQNYIQDRPVTPKAVAKELYTFDFYSPGWSNDTTGWLVVASVMVSILLVSRILFGLLIRHALKSEL